MSSVSIVVHQQQHTLGEPLSGDVVVTVSHPVQVDHVTLYIDGREKVYWEGPEMEVVEPKKPTDRPTTRPAHRKDSHHFLKEKLVLSGACTLQAGQNTFRFMHQLSAGHPASFYVKTTTNNRPVKAKVAYDLSAEVDVHHAKALKTNVSLFVGQRHRGPVSPVEVQNKKSFLMNKGKLSMRVELDKDVYVPGEEVKMKLELINESVKKVNGINVDLFRHMALRVHSHQLTLSESAHHLRLEGVAEATRDCRYATFNLPADFSRLTTKGDMIDVKYDLKVECDVPMAIDLSVHIPLVLTVPQQLDVRTKTYTLPADIEHDAIVRQGDTYHEQTPLVLPPSTGEMCSGGCILF